MGAGPWARDHAEQVATVLDRAAGSRATPHNAVTLLIDGPDTFDAMADAIARAERVVHLENYIIRDDGVGRRFAELLIARRRAGVEVAVLSDWLGSFGTARGYWRRLREAGVLVRHFHPPALLDPVENLARDHRKVLVVDGRTAIVGGLCLGDEWQGDAARGRAPWRDTALRIVGPAVPVLDGAFRDIWRRAGGHLAPDPLEPDAPAAGEASVRVVASRPGRDHGSRVTELLMAGAHSRLWITDAYFVPAPRLRQLLRDAARDRADVRVLVPGTSDLPLVRNLTRLGYRELLEAGVRIFEWSGPMIHAKSVVADRRWVRVGSSNLNISSLSANFELDLLVDDPALAAAMEAQFLRDLAGAHEVVLRGPRRRPQPEQPPPADALPPHRATPRERRRRTLVAVRAVAAAARRSLLLPLGAVSGALALLVILLPKTMGVIFALLFGWLAGGTVRAALRRREER